jgi:DNA-binding transcriptional ArsR family regulator
MVITQNTLQIDTSGLRKAALFYRAVNNKLRQQILLLLHKEKSMDVTSIYVTLHLEQSVCSQHLAVLRKAQLVAAKKVGKNVYYTVNYQKLDQLHQTALSLLH